MTKFPHPLRPDIVGEAGVVVAGHPMAAQIGLDVLRTGGGAVDAAVAAAAALTVLRPHMCGLGGDAFILVYDPERRSVATLNGSGRAAAAATPEALAERGHRTRVPVHGPHVATLTVPGALAAWADVLDRFGSRPLAELLQPARELAARGFPMYRRLAETIAATTPQDPGLAAILRPDGRPPAVGERFVQPALAATLDAIIAEGPSAFYRGRVARALAAFAARTGGFLTLEDLAAHRSDWVEPLTAPYAGRTVVGMAPNASGLSLLLLLRIAEGLGLDRWSWDSAEAVHLWVEAKKVAFADRDRYLADPAAMPAPASSLLDEDYVRRRRAVVNRERAASYAPGALGQAATGGDTTYLCVIDRRGRGVSLMQSLFQSFGSAVADPETGVIWHNRGAGFVLTPDHPNRLAPGKRPFHTLCPALVLDAEGRLEALVGTPGAHAQPQTLAQLLDALLRLGASPQEAIERPRWRHDADPAGEYGGVAGGMGQVVLEGRFPEATAEGLRARGHTVSVIDPWSASTGGASVIRVDPRTGLRTAGADPRRETYAVAEWA
ncbi:MAG TPA: gamma-glutamyltransferase [Thermodesulfobacteriota bacterium]